MMIPGVKFKIVKNLVSQLPNFGVGWVFHYLMQCCLGHTASAPKGRKGQIQGAAQRAADKQKVQLLENVTI